jgi:hypothetical protein
MAYETEITAEELICRAQTEAEKLARKLDEANAERRIKPLMASRDQFVKLMTSHLAKIFVHRGSIKP